jgi:hypothetical protein
VLNKKIEKLDSNLAILSVNKELKDKKYAKMKREVYDKLINDFLNSLKAKQPETYREKLKTLS